MSSLLLPLVKRSLPYILLLPTSLITLPPTLLLHLNTHPSPTPISLLRDPLSHPLHLPLLFLIVTIPIVYALGLLTGLISWVDKIWPFYTPLTSALIIAWLAYNPQAGVYGHNTPRVGLMFLLQLIWSIRINSHAVRRGFYELKSEDYRYTTVRKIVPWYIFAGVHLFAVAIFQPALLFALALPVQAVLSLPPSELSAGPFNIHLPFSAIKPFLPASYHSALDSTPVLNLADLFITIVALGCVYVEYVVDNANFEFQQAKHAPPPGTAMVQPKHSNPPNYPPAAAYPVHLHPGFPTKGIWRWSRHPNFAGEQIFWATQAMFVSFAAEISGVTRSGWMGGDVWGPCLTVSYICRVHLHTPLQALPGCCTRLSHLGKTKETADAVSSACCSREVLS